jgi:hypothetical protein
VSAITVGFSGGMPSDTFPSLRRSRIPSTPASTTTPATPMTITGIIGTKTSAGSTCSAVAARARGPPHGVRFMTPLARIVTQVRLSAFMPSRLYRGRIDATVIM